MRPPSSLADPQSPPAPALDDDALAAVAQLWKRSGRELRARFGGSSMRPSLTPENEVVLRCGAPPSVGDIVAYLVNGRMVLHRVEVCARDGSLLTRGDALWLPDPPVRDPAAVLGVVTAVDRGSGFEPAPAPPPSAARRVALWPFRAILAASPGAASAVLGGLVWSRRLLFSAGRVLGGVFRVPPG